MKKNPSSKKQKTNIADIPSNNTYIFNPILITGELIPGAGEDNHYIFSDNKYTAAAVFDGCGGLGSRRYPSEGGRTGAYLAAKLSADALALFIEKEKDENFSSYLSAYLKKENKRLDSVNPQQHIHSDMLCPLPTTAAIVFIEGSSCRFSWIGDSRIYLFDRFGLHILSSDDGKFEKSDTFIDERRLSSYANGLNDFTMYDGSFGISSPSFIITVTDGFYRAYSSPMEIEYVFLSAMYDSENADVFSEKLTALTDENCDDDFTAIICPVGFTSIDEAKKELSERYTYLKAFYSPLIGCSQAHFAAQEKILWEDYKESYFKYYIKG